jgi:hypothetical protein
VRFASKKGGACKMRLFVMGVTDLLDRWPEGQQRRRQLFTLEVCGLWSGLVRRCGGSIGWLAGWLVGWLVGLMDTWID